MNRPAHCLLVALAWLSLAAVADAQPKAPRLAPLGLPPGQTIDAVLHGAALDEPLAIVATRGVIVEVLPEIDSEGNAVAVEPGKRTRARLRIATPDSATAGPVVLAVATPQGASRPLLAWIDSLAGVTADAGATSWEAAQPLELPVAVEGVIAPQTSTFFRFTGRAGQRVAVDVIAQRCGSPLDGLLVVADAEGRIVVTADDDEGAGADPRAAFTLPADGDYFLELRDSRHAGGAGHAYRLRIGDLPLVDAVLPGGVALGPAPDGAPPEASPPTPADDGWQEDVVYAAARGTAGDTAAAFTPWSGPVRNAAESSGASPLPAGRLLLAGAFPEPGASHLFPFAAAAGQTFNLRSRTGRLGLPSKLDVQVLRDDGAIAARGVLELPAEQWRFTAPGEGPWRLRVAELLGRGGPAHGYALELEPAAGDLQVDLRNVKETDVARTAPVNGVATFDVDLRRTGFDGPVSFELLPADGPLRLLQDTVAEKAANGKVTLAWRREPQPGELALVRVVARAAVGEQRVERLVGTRAFLRGQAGWPHVPPAIDGWFAVAAVAAIEPIFTARMVETSVAASPGGEARWAIEVADRHGEFKEGVGVVALAAPAGWRVTAARQGEGAPERYDVTVSLPDDAAPGDYELSLAAHGEFKGQGRLVRLAATVRVAAAPADEPAAESPASKE